MAQALDPIRLFQQLEQLQQAVFRCAVGCSPFVSSPLAAPLHVFSVEQLYSGKASCREERPRSDMQGSKPCTESRSGENGCWAGDAPTKTPLKESGSRSCPGWLPILNGAAATFSGSYSASPLDAINHYKSARYSAGCARSEPICWKPGRSSGKKK